MTRLERSIGRVLRAGVGTSSVCMAVGLVLSLAAPTGGVASPAATALLQVGILILLCTPVARVVISTIEYVAARDWPFAALTAIVLVELFASAVAALWFNQRL